MSKLLPERFRPRDHGLVAEVDGFAFHSSKSAFEQDRSRGADLVAAGLRVVRVTWRQLVRNQKRSSRV